jgi:transcription-repair coupling factor (superfamily II helicase)
MNWFYNRLEKYSRILENKAYGFSNVSLIQEATLIRSSHKRPIVLIKDNSIQSEKSQTSLQFLDPSLNIVRLEQEESIRVQAIASSPEGLQARLLSLYRLMNEQVDVIITSSPTLLQYLPAIQTIKDHEQLIRINDEIELDELSNKLLSAGYKRTSVVEQVLSFAKRGGIIDVYSIQHKNPCRIEFFDNIIESIRFFDVETQQTIETVDELHLFVASDQLLNDDQKSEVRNKVTNFVGSSDETLEVTVMTHLEELLAGFYDPVHYQYFSLASGLGSVLDYVKNPLIIINHRDAVERSSRFFIKESIEFQQEQISENLRLPIFDQFQNFERLVDRYKPIYFEQFQTKKESYKFPIYEIFHPQLELEDLLEHISKQALEYKVVLSVSVKEINRLIDTLMKLDLPYSMVTSDRLVSGINVQVHALNRGFVFEEDTYVYSSFELFNVIHKRGRYDYQFRSSQSLRGLADLKIGDYVVHRNHGIGKYLGLETKEVDNNHKDFLHIAYQNNDVLLVPLEQFKLVRKFISSEGVNIRLSKLGSSAWAKTKERIKNSVDDIADRLIQLYQARQKQKGYAFSKDTPLLQEFESEFEHELTPEQVIAVREMKSDMEKTQPMDRLLIGDVGFGKTEVAIRGAFKAVTDNKQVVFLCPTTVLSQQHFRTFKERFKNYPVNIGLLNRFVEESHQKKILKDVKDGKIDILIGTHRVLSKDVKYHDLGFLIIDEEQRFGVAQKERIKELKLDVDVLSLSATPIPRTLQMSLVGLRSLSQLNTPPADRLPVMTHVVEKSEKLIYDIIEKEMARLGQVFYLYNNTNNIFAVAYKIQQHFLDFKVGVAHGKMDRHEIEQVMLDFNDNTIQILVCTTIVETGIDIPNANTMIIDQADRFGLSQLYQIKGRVGRSDRLAYAYLMIDPQKQLSEIATKRLEAIKEFTQLGSGYKIAMRDLTIRGAGEILGGNQSGFIDTVGMDLYIELLQEALAEKQSIPIEKPKELNFNINVDGYIPDEYTADAGLKIDLYQQIDKIKTLTQLSKFYEKTADRYGKFDRALFLLLEKKQLELFLSEPHVEDFKDRPRQYEILLNEEFSNQVDGIKLFELVNKVNNHIKLKYLKNKITLIIPKSRTALYDMIEVLQGIKKKEVSQAN